MLSVSFPKPVMRRTLNWKLVFWTLTTFVVVAAFLHFLHGFQVHRNAGRLLERANKAKQAGDLEPDVAKRAAHWEQAAAYYSHYLSFEPDDTAALAQLGLTLDQQAASADDWLRSVRIFEEVLRHEPDRNQLRHCLVLDLIRLHRFPEAINNIQTLMPQWNDQADLEHVLGWCLEANGEYGKSAAAFSRAIKLNPKRLESYVILADVLQNRLARVRDGANVMDDMVLANARSDRAYLIRYEFRRRRGDYVEAEADLHRALELAPAKPAVLLAGADWARAKGDLDQARVWLHKAWQMDPTHLDVVKALARLERQAGKRAEAAAILATALQHSPDAMELRILLADLLIDEGKYAEATAKVNALLADGAPKAFGDFLRARLAMAAAQWPKAVAYLESASAGLGITDWSKRVHALLGQCYEQAGHDDKAIDRYQQAIKLGDRQTATLSRLAQLLVRFERHVEAEQLLEKAAEQRALPLELVRLQADVALANQNPEAALRLAAVAVNGTSTDYRDYLWLGRLYHGAGADASGEAALRQATAVAPLTPDVWIALVEQLTRMGRREAALSIAAQVKDKVSPSLTGFAEARCYEVMGLVDLAETHYRSACAQDGGDFTLLAHAADFFLQTEQPDKARPYLEALVKSASIVPAEFATRARRQLAVILGAHGGADHARALALIEENAGVRPNNPSDLRARAYLQAATPEQRRQPIRVFEETASRQPLAPEERLQLAQLFDANGDQPRAGEQLVALLTLQPENPQFLAAFIRHLIKNEDFERAREQLQKLERLEQGSPRTLELQRTLAAEAN
jgi:tetratricopeptide (TPR) repeat protein